MRLRTALLVLPAIVLTAGTATGLTVALRRKGATHKLVCACACTDQHSWIERILRRARRRVQQLAPARHSFFCRVG